ncbi:hypothetical protein FCM35_KLT02241 [Carex littledalei]|uniref:Uncharacterized protein n=1 Tax=Carex littledalei TaxID=544730 RepID=A0A833QZV1_9POAL|nr:hypothetical protein FCM35_KLT02241 [Carex littledalei]
MDTATFARKITYIQLMLNPPGTLSGTSSGSRPLHGINILFYLLSQEGHTEHSPLDKFLLDRAGHHLAGNLTSLFIPLLCSFRASIPRGHRFARVEIRAAAEVALGTPAFEIEVVETGR